MTKKRIRITDGGIALPLGNNTFLMRGRLHSQGGIGIGNGGKNDIEVEDGEVVKFNKNNIQVLSDQPMLNGISPANALLAGGNFNKIFKAQQSINGNYGGSYAENGSKKYTYIGGTPEESRKKYYEFDIKLTDVINAISKEYDIAPELLFHRLSKEGIIDRAILHNNENYFRNKKYNENNEFVSIIDKTIFDPFTEIGLDDGFDNYSNYNLKRNIPIAENKRYNEKGRLVNSVQTANVQDAIELMAAELNYRKSILVKNGINPTNALISASYNRGINGVIDNNNKENLEKEYSIPNTYNSLIRDITYKPDDRFMNTLYVDQVHKNLQEMNDSYIVTHKHDKNNKIDYFNNNYQNHFKGIDEKTINNILNEFLKLGNGNSQSYDIEDAILLNDVEKLNTSDITLLKNKYKNGGQINMKLKHKNKQDITDRVMKEILPHSTGERKKFVLGGSEWSLLGNIGANILNGFTQGIIGSINSSRLGKLYDSMKRKSTYVPVAREHIDTRVDIQPQLTSLKQAEHTLIENANANTSNSKVARQQARTAVANRIQQEHTVYGAKHDKEHSLRTAEGQLQTQYNLADAASLSADIKDQNDFDMMKIMGKANAKTAEAQAWGQGMASMLQNTGQSLMDYAQMNTDLLKSNNPNAYDQWFTKEYGHLKNKVTDTKWIEKHQDWFNNNKTVLTRLGWITQ